MKKLLLIVFVFAFNFWAFAQKEEVMISDSDTTVYQAVDSSASFNENIRAYFSEKILYPMFDKREKSFSTYWVQFLIEKDGSVSNVETIKLPNRNDIVDSSFISLNKETIINMPNWTPAILNGELVRSYYTFRFHICSSKVVRYNYIKN